MKILFQSRKTLFSGPGGDTIQMLKTAEYLKKIGVEVDISTELTPDLTNYDIVHLFNLMNPQDLFLKMRNCKKQKIPYVLSTIYGRYDEYDKKGRTGIYKLIANILSYYQIEYCKIIARAIKNFDLQTGTLLYLIHGQYKTQKMLTENTSVFLPNSQSEMDRVAYDYSLQDFNHVVIPNAVDIKKFSTENLVESGKFDKYKGCVLCVARIEGRKATLNLIKAFRNLPYKLVLIGNVSPNSKAYYKQCLEEAGDNIVFHGPVDHDELPELYSVAKVHALTSWMETPGLSTIEAAAMGCNVVATKKGDTYDYFKDFAFYCEPDDPQSISLAIQKAYESEFDERFRLRIKENYIWEKTAEKTKKAYEMALVGS